MSLHASNAGVYNADAGPKTGIGKCASNSTPSCFLLSSGERTLDQFCNTSGAIWMMPEAQVVISMSGPIQKARQ